MTAFLTLMRRELWEHRSLVWAPLVTALLLVLATFFGSRVGGLEFELGDQEAGFFSDLAATPAAQVQLFAVWMGSLLIPQLIVGLLVVFFYLLDALYGERRDRSILFWKSLPISDASTVLSKFTVAALLMPVWIWGISLISGVLIFLIVKFMVADTALAPLGVWHSSAWLLVQATLLQNLLIAALWYAPIAAWLLVISVFAKRSPFFWAVLPPLLVAILEEVAFGTGRILTFVGHRLSGYFQALQPGLMRSRDDETTLQTVAEAYQALSAAPLLTSSSLWLGVLSAALLLALAIRLRRWRDDA